jgi:hypothetical protein
VRTHNRLPGDGPHFNDKVFKFLTGPDIENPLVATSADKWLSKLVAHGLVGRDISVPTLGVLTTPEEIDQFHFPERCAIKATHSSGDTILLSAGEEPDRTEIKSWLKHDFYKASREKSYRNLKPRVVVEPILFENHDVHDFKIFCRNGEPKAVLFVQDRNVAFGRAVLTTDFAPTDINMTPPVETLPEKPACWEDILDLTRKISSVFTFVRVDWYIMGDEYYLGEISHGHMRALEIFPDERSEIALGRMIFED